MAPAVCKTCGGSFQANAGQMLYCGRDCYLADIRERAAATLVARFWSFVNKNGPIPAHCPELDPCWLWTGNLVRGYGQFTLPRTPDGKQHKIYAHRFAYEITNGKIPDSLSILHKCDTAACSNPNHLMPGTQADNLADARAKGRLDPTAPRTRQLTLADRLAIYHAPRDRDTSVRLMRRYGISKAVLFHTRQGRFVGSPEHEAITFSKASTLADSAATTFTSSNRTRAVRG